MPARACGWGGGWRRRARRRRRGKGGGKLARDRDLLIGWVERDGEITMLELATRLRRERQVVVHPASLSRFLRAAGRDDVARARRTWRATRQPRMRKEPHRLLVFVDGTGTTTKMARLRAAQDEASG